MTRDMRSAHALYIVDVFVVCFFMLKVVLLNDTQTYKNCCIPSCSGHKLVYLYPKCLIIKCCIYECLKWLISSVTCTCVCRVVQLNIWLIHSHFGNILPSNLDIWCSVAYYNFSANVLQPHVAMVPIYHSEEVYIFLKRTQTQRNNLPVKCRYITSGQW